MALRTWRIGLAAAAAVLAVQPAWADPIPQPVEAMIRAAARRNDATLGATADTAKQAYPKSAKEIDRLVKTLRAVASLRHRAKLEHQGLLRGWKGQGTLGASSTSGDTRNTGVSMGLHFSREGLLWTHTFIGSLDYQRTNGVETQARYFTSYQSNYQFNDRLYVLGLASWEDNRFSGFDQRFTESLGFGYALLRGPKTTLSLEGGPALRQTDYVPDGPHNSIATRVALNYGWNLLSNLKLAEECSYYNEDRDSTLTSNIALTVGLIGSLSVQTSYLAQYESQPQPGLKRYNGTSRLSLAYSF